MTARRAGTEMSGPEPVIELGIACCTAKILLASFELQVL
jgi:hypothetical protein